MGYTLEISTAHFTNKFFSFRYKSIVINMTNGSAQNEGEKLDSEHEGIDGSPDASDEDPKITLLGPLVDLHACGICYQLYNDSERLPKVLSCGHTNCFMCLSSWVEHSSSPFPVCAICQVLRRMKLISTDGNEALSKEPNSSSSVADTTASDMAAVCEKIDEHMNDVASLLESQMERLSMSQEQQSLSNADCSSPLRTVEDSVAEFLQRWESTKNCLLTSSKPIVKSRECDLMTHIIELMYPRSASEMFRMFEDISLSSYDNLNVTPSDEEGHRLIAHNESESFPEHSYSDFSAIGSDSHESTISASLSSSQDGDTSGFEDLNNTIIFPHITVCPKFYFYKSIYLMFFVFKTLVQMHVSYYYYASIACGQNVPMYEFETIDSFSYCTLCQCQLPRNFASHQTHVLGRRHQMNDAIGRSADSTTPGRGWSLNPHPIRHHTRRNLNSSNSGQNTNPANARTTGRVGNENRTAEIPDWMRYFPPEENGIGVPDRPFWRSGNNHPVVDGNDRLFGRRNQSDNTYEWYYGRNPIPDNSNPRGHNNTQRRSQSGMQSDRINTDRRNGQRPHSSGRSGLSTIGRLVRISDTRPTYGRPIHSSNDDSSRWDFLNERMSGQSIPPTWDQYIGLRYPL
ncbi:zinc finger, C3HC4 type [Dictyocaulus viviparus]|uniref:Zinc finger, C3HC4 type n=1 Tax=Dictyocaulus viviparus TaxID=29172 RepID=A0A0D8Y934_DICVI|nr:zinc finger, C3HC4 type [Dictyocaulus viviparus]